MYRSEVTPRVWTRIRSIIRPVANPNTAPVSDPHRSPIDITTSGVRSALTPKIDTCETADSWITTAKKPSRINRMGSLTALLTSGLFRKRPLRHLGPRGAGLRLGQDLDDVDAAQVGLRRDLDRPVVEQLVLVDRQDVPDRDVCREVGLERTRLESGGDHQLALLRPVLDLPRVRGLEILEHELIRVADRGHELAGVAIGVEHARGHRQRVVGDQRHE